MDNNAAYRLYFVVFYYFAVIIGSNIFVAFILDMYDAVITLEEERKSTFDGLQKEINQWKYEMLQMKKDKKYEDPKDYKKSEDTSNSGSITNTIR